MLRTIEWGAVRDFSSTIFSWFRVFNLLLFCRLLSIRYHFIEDDNFIFISSSARCLSFSFPSTRSHFRTCATHLRRQKRYVKRFSSLRFFQPSFHIEISVELSDKVPIPPHPAAKRTEKQSQSLEDDNDGRRNFTHFDIIYPFTMALRLFSLFIYHSTICVVFFAAQMNWWPSHVISVNKNERVRIKLTSEKAMEKKNSRRKSETKWSKLLAANWSDWNWIKFHFLRFDDSVDGRRLHDFYQY